MPVEIRELVVRVVVDPETAPAGEGARLDDGERAALIQACVDETLRALRRREER